MSETILHPRATTGLVGHQQAEAELLQAWQGKRLHHAWMITGPRGIGKATLAYRFARFILNGGATGGSSGLFGTSTPQNLAIDPANSVAVRIAAGSHPDLLTIERGVNEKTGKMRGEVVVEDVRGVREFMALTPAEGGWRIVIVDSADEMNKAAANALLKILEEPPPRALLLLVCHAPGRILATIRSRCRMMSLSPLSQEQVEQVLTQTLPDLDMDDRHILARLSDGSPGRAVVLAEEEGAELQQKLLQIIKSLPTLDVAATYELADRMGKAEGGWSCLEELFERLVSRLLRAAVGAELGVEAIEGENALIQKAASRAQKNSLLDFAEKSLEMMRRADPLNLDRRQTLLQIFVAAQAAFRA